LAQNYEKVSERPNFFAKTFRSSLENSFFYVFLSVKPLFLGKSGCKETGYILFDDLVGP
jgi:hypothetical protein